MGGCGTLDRLYTSNEADFELRQLNWIDSGEHNEAIIVRQWELPPREIVKPRFIALAPAGEPLESEFLSLMVEWQGATRIMSSMTDKVTHKAYQRIIGLGKPALPLIMRQLSKELDHWFWALRAISGENPVPRNHVGKLDKMAGDWLRLGRARGWIA